MVVYHTNSVFYHLFVLNKNKKYSSVAVFCSVCTNLFYCARFSSAPAPAVCSRVEVLRSNPLISVISHSDCVATRDQRFILPFWQGANPSTETSAPKLPQPTVYSTGICEVWISGVETRVTVLTILNHSASLVNISLVLQGFFFINAATKWHVCCLSFLTVKSLVVFSEYYKICIRSHKKKRMFPASIGTLNQIECFRGQNKPLMLHFGHKCLSYKTSWPNLAFLVNGLCVGILHDFSFLQCFAKFCAMIISSYNTPNYNWNLIWFFPPSSCNLFPCENTTPRMKVQI